MIMTKYFVFIYFNCCNHLPIYNFNLQTEWGKDLSEQLHESNARERDLQHEHEDLKCHNAQSEEKLVVMKKQVTHHKGKYTGRKR